MLRGPVDRGLTQAQHEATDLRSFLYHNRVRGGVAGASLLEEECATAQFKLDHSPDGFGHYVLRGKHWHKMCDFQITGLECTMVREAVGGCQNAETKNRR
mmetsp:Transcript_47694/g.154771  ORF Transcript_47694/g.154771 Transcript_47694/m.154771 type:complete len:100 (+) Transcript_47694:2348-2647(+)